MVKSWKNFQVFSDFETFSRIIISLKTMDFMTMVNFDSSVMSLKFFIAYRLNIDVHFF